MTSPIKHLVLFDIDGTLLMPDGAGRASLKLALEQVYGTAGEIATFSLAGSLDRLTVRLLMTEAGIAPDVIWAGFPALSTIMEAELRRRITAGMHHVTPCPGGLELVAALAARDDVLLGLLTGNFHVTAAVKLEAAGYDPTVFRVGAFGDEAEDRAELPPLAIERGSALAGVRFEGRQVVIIGDTPSDIGCGRGVGARSIGVASGWTPRAELEAHHPHYLFDNLADTQAVLKAILAPTG